MWILTLKNLQKSLIQHQSSRRRSLKSDLIKIKECFKENLPSDVFKLLSETETTYRTKLSLKTSTVLEKISTYESGYIEKCVLLNEETSRSISNNILTHSNGNKRTTFFDGEGGMCHVANNITNSKRFKKVLVLEKDMSLECLHQYAKSHYLPQKVQVYDVNFPKIASNKLLQKSSFVSPFLEYTPKGKKDEEIPSYTLLTTATQGFLKYLASRMLYHDDPFGDFYAARPEYFFIVTARTYFHICCGIGETDPIPEKLSEEEVESFNKATSINGRLFKKYNVLFNILFDFYLIDRLPRNSFFPWKTHKSYNMAQRATPRIGLDKLYAEYNENFFLIYVRPKRTKDLPFKNPIYFDYFLSVMLQNKGRRIVDVFEMWSSGWGYYLIEAGFDILTIVDDLEMNELIQIYHILESIPDFKNSNFVILATEMYKSEHEEGNILEDKEMDHYRTNLRRKMSQGEEEE